MSSAAYQGLTFTRIRRVGSITDSYRNDLGILSVLNTRRQILKWLSPLAPRERHRAIRKGRADGIGDWLLRTNEFERWCTGEDQTVHPVLFCYGNPGVGKTYLRCVKVALLKWRAKLNP